MNEAFTKSRLLDAIEYIDDEYIASAARYKMKIKPHASEPPVQTVGGSLKKYWKQYLGLVACLVLMSLVTPLISVVPEVIKSFASSWWDITEFVESTAEITIDEESSTTQWSVSEDELISAYINYQGNGDVSNKSGYRIEKIDYLDHNICAFSITSSNWMFLDDMMVYEFVDGYIIPNTKACVRVIYDGKSVYSFCDAYSTGVIDEKDLQLLGAKVEQSVYGDNAFINKVIEDFVTQYGSDEYSRDVANYCVSYCNDLGNDIYSLYIYYKDLSIINDPIVQTIDGYTIINYFGGGMKIYKDGAFYPLLHAYNKRVIDLDVIKKISINSK